LNLSGLTELDIATSDRQPIWLSRNNQQDATLY